MIATIKAEFRKLFSVRSTYYVLALVIALVIFFSFYVVGWHLNDKSGLLNPFDLANNDITSAVNTISIFSALIALLLFTHEYRYNTIMYTLTSSNSRSKVLLAKILVVSGFSIVFTLFVATAAPLLTLLGIHLHHLELVHQTLFYRNLLWRCLFFGWGYAMAGLVIGSLIRNQVGAIVTLFIAPGVLESLIGLLIKNNVAYLPFSSLHVVIGQGMSSGNWVTSITPLHAAFVFTGYLIVSWLAAWILFVRRDAN